MSHELHQLFDPESSTFTYVLVDLPTREAVVVDSVDHLTERDLSLVRRLGLTVRYVVETHAHDDRRQGRSAVQVRDLSGRRAARARRHAALWRKRGIARDPHARTHVGQHELPVAQQRPHRRY